MLVSQQDAAVYQKTATLYCVHTADAERANHFVDNLGTVTPASHYCESRSFCEIDSIHSIRLKPCVCVD